MWRPPAQFVYLHRSAALCSCRRMGVAWSNCCRMTIESHSSRSRIAVVITTKLPSRKKAAHIIRHFGWQHQWRRIFHRYTVERRCRRFIRSTIALFGKEFHTLTEVQYVCEFTTSELARKSTRAVDSGRYLLVDNAMVTTTNSTSIRRAFDCLSKVIKVTVT